MFLIYHIDFWSGEWDFTRAVSAAWPRPLLSDKPGLLGTRPGKQAKPVQHDYG